MYFYFTLFCFSVTVYKMITTCQLLLYRIFCVCILLCNHCQAQSRYSSPEENIKEAQDVVKDINESLENIGKGKNVCNRTLNQVSTRMDELGEKIQDLYKGDFFFKFLIGKLLFIIIIIIIVVVVNKTWQ